MKTVIASLLGLMITPSAAHAADGLKLNIIGEGIARAPAEFMKLTIKVAAQCNPTAREARAALETQMEGVAAVLEKHLDRTVEQQLQKIAGIAQKSELTEYEDGRQVKVCDSSWHSIGTIVFKLTEKKELESVQDDILALDPNIRMPVSVPRSSVSMSQPQPGIFANTYDQLTDTALERALAQATRQARVLLQQTGGGDVRLSKMAPSMNSGGILYDRTGFGSDPEASEEVSVSVQIAREFTFQVVNP